MQAADITCGNPLFVPAIVRPCQMFPPQARSVVFPGEVRLARAVLRDAFLCMRGHVTVCAGGSVRQRERLQRRAQWQAWEWIFDDSDDGLFSFENVCAWLDLDPQAVRAEVRAGAT